MSLYSDSEHPIRAAIVGAHEQTLASFAAPGTWWTGAQRCAIVAEARDARGAAGMQEPVDAAGTATAGQVELPEVVCRVTRQVAVSTGDLDRGFFEQALADGLSDAEYTETIGVVARAAGMDVFARGIGVPPRALSPPVAGEPPRTRPATARDEGAWTATIPGGRRGAQEAVDTYGSDALPAAPFIYRALSLVPAEARDLIRLGSAQYVVLEEFMNLDFTFEPEITRAQVELLAARVSAINQCFY
jgi:hypothetical protein